MTAKVTIQFENTTLTRTVKVGPTYTHAEMQLGDVADRLATEAVREEQRARKEEKDVVQ